MINPRFIVGIWFGAVATSVGFALWIASKPIKAPAVTLLGHYKYQVASAATLTPVDKRGEVLMRPAAATAFKRMQKAAKTQGIWIVPVSGFRDLAHQERLFFDKAATNAETLAERARTCAPPGYSEHHTGYSLDLGDGARADPHLELTFKDTRAYQWLKANAARYHFEMSFPKGNRQKLAFEPWHWRYVGDLKSFRTFYYARFGDQP